MRLAYVVLALLPFAAAADVYTDTDGTTFAVADQTLTITTPDSVDGVIVTNEYDYTTLLTGVTNVVKKGACGLLLRAAPDYAGDWHI